MSLYTAYLIALGISIFFSIISCLVMFVPRRPEPLLDIVLRRLPQAERLKKNTLEKSPGTSGLRNK